MIKAAEFLKDRFNENYFINNKAISLTTEQLRQLLEDFLTVALKEQEQNEKQDSDRTIPVEGTKRPTKEDAARKPSGGH
jgi:hypothetical protein